MTSTERKSSTSPAISGKRSSVLNSIRKRLKRRCSSEDPNGIAFLRQWKSKFEGESKEKGKGIGWLELPSENIGVQFCLDSSLHGLKYIGQRERHMSERIFWLLTFLVMLSVAAWLITEMWNKYKLNPVIVSFQPFETNVDQVPFPSVTVCNMNKVMRSKAEEYARKASAGDIDAAKELYYLNHVCSATQSFSRRFNFTTLNGTMPIDESDRFSTENLTRVNGFLRRAAQNCTDLLRLCVWQDQEVDCAEIFRPIETEFGKCCTFNMVPLSLLYTKRNDSRETTAEILQWEKWDIDQDGLLITGSPEEKEFPRRQMKAGLSNGLSFLLNVDSSEYYCTSSDSIGFRMATHLPIDLPKVADFGISLRPKSEMFVDVLPQITMVDKDIFSYSLDKRNCYRIGEFKLAFYKYYSVNNCVDECIANATKMACGCKRYYMPRTVHEKLCGPHKFECAEQAKCTITFCMTDKKTKDGIRNTCPLCLASCTEVNYQTQVTSAPLRDGIWNFDNGSSPRWKEHDLSIVHIYIGLDSFYAKVRKELYGSTDLFANTGGLMGLCLGFSGLSLIEVIYFLTLRAWWRRKRTLREVTEQDEQSTKWARTTFKTPRIMEKLKTSQNIVAYYKSVFGKLKLDDQDQ